ncbi:MAG: DUF3800 domain-containing protein [Planctomycetes bacterium]|nr:DUF3800 domain-containing protein [Planctomycetota bacterium]
MTESYNIYCDESCHLEHELIPIMVLGCVWSLVDKTIEISQRIREIKAKHNMSNSFEIKWTKVSASKAAFYVDLVDYFFDDDDLHFRGVLIPDKGILNHKAYEQTHDSWYYKMLFVMLEPIIDPLSNYRIYLDIKDTRSEQKRIILEKVLRNSRYDYVAHIIERVQQIRSHESELLQMADLLLGAVGYFNRTQIGDLKDKEQNQGKITVIRRIQRRSGKSLINTTWLREPKFNLLVWHPNEQRGHDE